MVGRFGGVLESQRLEALVAYWTVYVEKRLQLRLARSVWDKGATPVNTGIPGTSPDPWHMSFLIIWVHRVFSKLAGTSWASYVSK